MCLSDNSGVTSTNRLINKLNTQPISSFLELMGCVKAYIFTGRPVPIISWQKVRIYIADFPSR